jgi:hypothetical protein
VSPGRIGRAAAGQALAMKAFPRVRFALAVLLLFAGVLALWLAQRAAAMYAGALRV